MSVTESKQPPYAEADSPQLDCFRYLIDDGVEHHVAQLEGAERSSTAHRPMHRRDGPDCSRRSVCPQPSLRPRPRAATPADAPSGGARSAQLERVAQRHQRDAGSIDHRKRDACTAPATVGERGLGGEQRRLDGSVGTRSMAFRSAAAETGAPVVTAAAAAAPTYSAMARRRVD
jgi:hypothetical protein